MTMDLTLDPPRQAGGPIGAATNQGASYLVASSQVAARTLKKFVRSPALIVAGTAQGVLFLLIFRYVFGGAIAHTGALNYVDFLVPGFVVTGVLFQGMSAASGVADDQEGGLFDRLRSPAHPGAVHHHGPRGRRLGARRLGRDRHDRGGLRRRLPHRRFDGSTRSRPWGSPSSTASRSCGCSSSWGSRRAARRRPRASPSWSSR